MRLLEYSQIFFVGIGGSGMRGLAQILHSRGLSIAGSDSDVESLHSDDFASFTVYSEEDAVEKVKEAEAVVYSDAIVDAHPVLKAAVDAGLPTYSYQKALGELSNEYKTIAVTGTHGKSSTTALLGHMLTEAGLDPTVLLGAHVSAWRGNARVGSSDIFVVEADEYRGHFLELSPTHAIVTSIDFDHPDAFASMEETYAVYQQFLDKVDPSGSVFALPSTVSSHTALTWPAQTREVEGSDEVVPTLPGEHMKQNASLAVAVAEELGVSREDAVASLASFPGLSRRFEKIGVFKGIEVISDYGHHPAEILATLTAAAEQYQGKRILAVFEPHHAARLNQFFDDFVECFKGVSGLVIYPIFEPIGREVANERLDELKSDYADKVKSVVPTVMAVSSPAELFDYLDSSYDQFDVIIAFSAGVLDRDLRELLV